MGQTDVTVNFDEVPAEFNAATYFVDRHLEENRGDKIAFIDDRGSYRYADLAEQVNCAANVLKNLGLRQEARVAMAVLDCVEFPAVFLGGDQGRGHSNVPEYPADHRTLSLYPGARPRPGF